MTNLLTPAPQRSQPGVATMVRTIYKQLSSEEGQVETWAFVRVGSNEEDDECLPPGKYRVESKSKSNWSCRFIQPDLGQGVEPLTDEDDSDDEELIEPMDFMAGPFRPHRRPLLARIQHNGGGWFDAEAFSVDGTHYCALYQREGQFYADDHITDIIPGKEYILYIAADGEWGLNFREGY